jgi:hypothetical protein
MAEAQEHEEVTVTALQEALATADTEEALPVLAEVQATEVDPVLHVLPERGLPLDREEVRLVTAVDAVQADPVHAVRAADRAAVQVREVQAADRAVDHQVAEADLAEEETNSRAD